jgi:hypothetical protein
MGQVLVIDASLHRLHRPPRLLIHSLSLLSPDKLPSFSSLSTSITLYYSLLLYITLVHHLYVWVLFSHSIVHLSGSAVNNMQVTRMQVGMAGLERLRLWTETAG